MVESNCETNYCDINFMYDCYLEFAIGANVVKTAFIYGDLEENIYIKQSQDYVSQSLVSLCVSCERACMD